MTYGIQISNSSGVVTFDSSALGRLIVDFFISPATAPGGSYTKTYTLPAGRSVDIFCSPVGSWNPIWRTYLTLSYVGTTLTIQFNTPTTTSSFYVLVMLK
jgi:hypothetical protein